MQLEFFDVPSPCVSVCETDEKGLCLGCFRNRDERLNWNTFTCNDKQKVIKRCQQRKKRKNGFIKTTMTDITSVNQELDLKQPSLLNPPTKSKVENTTDLDFSNFDL